MCRAPSCAAPAPRGHGAESFAQALSNSCNPAFIQIGTKMGAQTFYSYFNVFGLTVPTGIDLPGEAQSQFYTAEGLGPVQLASCSFGQSNKVTPIQMITAVATIANGGNLVQPHLVSKILDANGNLVESIEPEAKRQVISEDTLPQDPRHHAGRKDGRPRLCTGLSGRRQERVPPRSWTRTIRMRGSPPSSGLPPAMIPRSRCWSSSTSRRTRLTARSSAAILPRRWSARS